MKTAWGGWMRQPNAAACCMQLSNFAQHAALLTLPSTLPLQGVRRGGQAGAAAEPLAQLWEQGAGRLRRRRRRRRGAAAALKVAGLHQRAEQDAGKPTAVLLHSFHMHGS